MDKKMSPGVPPSGSKETTKTKQNDDAVALDNFTSVKRSVKEGTTPTTVNGSAYLNIPATLQDLPQWGVWRREYTNGKPNNVPYDAKTGNHLSVTDPETWSPFAVALAAYQRGTRGQWDGITFILKEGGGLVGLDSDKCVDEGGNLTPEAQAILALWGSYMEHSPSRRGLRGFAFGTLPAGRRKVGHLEIYDSAKALTVTGWRLPDMPTTIETRPDAIREIHQQFFSQPKKHPATGTFNPDDYEPLTDDDILDLATRAKNGVRVRALLSGDLSGYASPSEADLAVCNVFAFYSGPDSHEQIDRLVREHFAGFRPDKWDKRHHANGDTYGLGTIKVALADRTEFYTRPREEAPFPGDADLPPMRAKKTRGNGLAAPSEAALAPRDPRAEVNAPPAPGAERDARKTIQISTDITKVVNAAENALLALPKGPHIYQRNGHLCFIAYNAIAPMPGDKWQQPLGAPIITALSVAQLQEGMSRAARWVKADQRSHSLVPALPPKWAVETLRDRRVWKFPVLADVICAPTLRADGEIVETPGYDRATGLFFDSQGVVFPSIPPRPTIDDARRAVAALTEPYSDFPLVEPYATSAVLAAELSLIARAAIRGCVPGFPADANTPGSGKGLLIDCICLTATGRPAPRWPQLYKNEDEERKRLLSIALEGDACCHIDNVTHPFGSAPLDLALTAGIAKDRLLGANKSAEAPLSCVFFASGNNMSFVGDMARRVVPIHLHSLEERPEDRDDFQQPELLNWIRANRPRLVGEALTLLRAYFLAGCPKQTSGYGSFEQWNGLVRGALVWAGCADPCEGRKIIEAEADPAHENLARLLYCWNVCYESNPVTLNTVLGDVRQRSADIIPNQWNELSDALAAFDSKYDGKYLDVRRIGNALRAVKGRNIEGSRLLQEGKQHQALLWVVKKV